MPPVGRQQGWNELHGTPSRAAIPPGILVPDPPTPRSRGGGNDTPTPATDSPGSWKRKKRTGEIVDRPPILRLNPPGSVGSTSPAIDQNGHGSRSRRLTDSPSTTDTFTTARDARGSSTGGPNVHGAEGLVQFPAPQEFEEDTESPEDVQPPPPARLPPTQAHQMDGVSENETSRHSPRKSRSCRDLCGSLGRKFKDCLTKERSPYDEARVRMIPEQPAARQPEKETWWSKSVRMLTQRGSRGKQRRALRKSVRDLFSGSSTANQTSTESTPYSNQQRYPYLFDHPTAPQNSINRENRFDNAAAPQAFGAPTHEEDLATSGTERTDPFPDPTSPTFSDPISEPITVIGPDADEPREVPRENTGPTDESMVARLDGTESDEGRELSRPFSFTHSNGGEGSGECLDESPVPFAMDELARVDSQEELVVPDGLRRYLHST
ncbi:MAG: hypothetical protein Q9183_003947 [Haloplaca sp. 2 TL-2023]